MSRVVAYLLLNAVVGEGIITLLVFWKPPIRSSYQFS